MTGVLFPWSSRVPVKVPNCRQPHLQASGTVLPQSHRFIFAQSEQERFNKDHDVNDRAKRQSDREKQEKFYNARLQKRMERDQEKWEGEEARDRKEESKRLHHQKVIVDNKRNSNG